MHPEFTEIHTHTQKRVTYMHTHTLKGLAVSKLPAKGVQIKS